MNSKRQYLAAPLMLSWVLLFSLAGNGQELSEKDKARLVKLDQMALSLQRVKVDKVRSTGDRKSDDRRYFNHTELHMRFLVGAAGLANNNQDGALIFPVQVSGLTSIVDSRSPSANKQDAGSDYQSVRVTLANILKERPKARIDLQNLKHGSTYDAVQIARDEIISRIRWFFPEAEIEGKQKFLVKKLAIKNETREPIHVWLHYRVSERNEGGYEWEWKPNAPGKGQPLQVTIAPGKTETVEDAGAPIQASRAMLWAESESGDQWLEHRHDPIWLVEPNKSLDDDRAYYAEKPATYEHAVRPHTGKRQFTERVIELTNGTDEALDVQLRYRTRSDGKVAWRSASFDLAPGESLAPRDSLGMRVRASRVQLTGETENRRYEQHAKEPIWMVAEVGGQRLYQAETIGKFAYSFTPSGESDAATSTARVTANSTNVVVGNQVVGTISRGQVVEVLERKPGWVRVRVKRQGAPLVGWVREQDLESTDAGPSSPPPEAVRKTLTVTASSADVTVGSQVIAKLSRGDKYPVLEDRRGWLRIELTVGDTMRNGWVNRQHVRVQ